MEKKKTKKIAWKKKKKKKLHGKKKKQKKLAWKKKSGLHACTNQLLFFRFINLFLFFQK